MIYHRILIFQTKLLHHFDLYTLSLKESLEKVTTLAMGPVAKTGLTVTTIIGTVAAAAKHSVGLAAIVMGMGVALSYYLTYLGAWGT